MATRTQSTVVAVFRNSSDAQAAANELKANGFTDGDIYISNYGAADATGTGTGTAGAQTSSYHEGGIKGWFKSLFGEDEQDRDRSYYEGAVSSGAVLLSVDVDDDNIDDAIDAIEKHNPEDVNRGMGESAASGTATSSAAAAGASRNTASSSATTSGGSTTRGKTSKGTTADLPKSIPVVQEDVRVGKRAVLRGGVRVYSRVVEQPVEQDVNLREEHVRVERQPVNRAVQPGDLQAGTDQVIEVEEYAEEAVVAKDARVVEEVRVSKDATQRTETVRDTVRRTEVNVENLGGGTAQTSGTMTGSTGNYDDDFRRDFQAKYAGSGGKYEDYGPAYQYGYQSASDPRYKGRSWDQVESDLRSGYGQRYPNSAWERMKDSIRYGWDKVTGKAKSASSSR